MKRIIVLCLAALLTSAQPAAATGDTGWSCPSGTVHVYKLDNLSGKTFTVPSAPAGWKVLGVSIKAGPDHYDYPTATSGQVIKVKVDTGHDVSHAHICKRKDRPSTTTSTTTTSTTTTTVPVTSTSTSTTVAPTTTVEETTTTTSTSSPSTTSPATTTTTTSSPIHTSTTSPTTTSSVVTTTTGATTTTALSTTSTSSPTVTRLPVTGQDESITMMWATLLLALGGLLVLTTRRVV